MELALIAATSFFALCLVGVGALVGRRRGAEELIDRAVVLVQTECPKCRRLVILPRGRVEVGGGKPAA